MTIKASQRAHGPDDDGLLSAKPAATSRIRPDHAASHGRSSPRDATSRRGTGAPKGKTGLPMDYQQGFFSGPSS